MIKDEELISVMNRSVGSASYRIPELNIRREFESREVKKITAGELRKLNYVPGGNEMLKSILLMNSKELLEEFNIDVEPEYFYTEAEIKDLLLYGSMDAFLDCLDFAPQSVIDLIKWVAVDLKINDYSKREAIKEKTGFNVTLAIENSGVNSTETPVAKRRVNADSTTTEKSRRTTTSPEATAEPKYKVIKK